MATWDEITTWDAAAIAEVGDVLARARRRVTDLQDEILDAAAPSAWSGPAADAATGELGRRRQELELLVAEVAAMGVATDRAEQAVQRLRQDVSEAEALAEAHDFRIDNGAVVDVATGDEVDVLARAAHHAELVGKVADVHRGAEEVDTELSDVLDKILGDRIDDAGATSLADAAFAGAGQAHDDLHDRLREKYRVAPDPDGMTEWPDGVTGWMWEQLGNKKSPMTTTEAAMLDELQTNQGLLGVKDLADIRQDALHQGEQVFDGQGGTDGHADAFRHAYWNARMTQRFGEDWAAEFATAHEGKPSSHTTPVAMDLHNNEVGRRIATENPGASPEELAALVEQAVRDGDMVVIDRHDSLEHSDRVDFGETRDTGPGNEWPQNTGERRDDTRPDEPSAYPERGY